MNKIELFLDFVKRKFGTPETFCGHGSYKDNSSEAKQFINHITFNYCIGSILDIGCGDLNWIDIDFLTKGEFGVKYTGYDFDKGFIEQNKKRFPYCTFIQSDIRLLTELPKVDLILCRDLLLHLETIHIESLLNVFLHSGSKWLITNNYDGVFENVNLNYNKEYTRRKRKSRDINLLIEPYSWIRFDDCILEKECADNRYLCLWDLDKVRSSKGILINTRKQN